MSTREIVLDGGSPWGFRMHGGADVGQPLRISRVNPGSKAALKGVREGDVISSINGQHTRSISNSDAHALLRNAGQTLHLGLNEECSGSPKRRIHRNVQQESKSVSVKRSTVTKTTTPVNGATDPNSNSQVWVKGDLQDGQNGGVKEISTGSTSDSKGPRRRRRLQSTPQHELSVDAKEDSDTIADKQDASKTLHSPTFSEGGGSKSRRRRRSRGNSRRKCRVGSALGVESVVSGTELKSGDQEREMSTTEPETDATMSDIGAKSEDFILHGGETSEVDTVEELASDETKQKVVFKKVQLTEANVLSVDANKKSVLDVDHESKSTVGVSSSAIRDVGKEREYDANVTSFTGREGSSLDDTRKKYTPGAVSWKYETSEPFYEKEIWEGGVKSNYRDDVGMETHGFEDKMRELNNTETGSTQTLSARDVDALVEEMAGINVRSKETEHVKEIIQVKESPEDIKSKFASQESTIEGLRENDVAQVDIGLLDKGKKISEEKYGYKNAAPSLSETVCEDVVVETGVKNIRGEVKGRTEFLINDETDAGTAGRQSYYGGIPECPLMSEGSNAEAESRKCENVNATVGNVVELQIENDCNRDTKTQISRSYRVTEKGNTQGDVTDCNALHSVNDSSGLKFINHVRENTQEHVKDFGLFVKNVSTICSAADTAVLGGITSLDSQEIRQNTGSEYSCGTLLHLPLTTDVSYSTGDQDCSSSETYECGIVKRSSESVIFKDTSFLREDYECTSSVEVRKSKAGECQDGCELAAPCVSGSLETTENNLQSKLCSNIVNETGRVITGTRNSGAADERVVRYLEISAEGDECSTECQQKEAYTVSEQPLLEYRAVVESGEEEVWEEVEELCSTGKIRKDDRVAENTMPVGDGGCPVMSNTSTFLKNDELSQEEKELLDPSPLIDADDEATLRRFLHSLNLADYSREAVRTRNAVLRDGSSEEVYAIRKGKRRVALETYSSQQRGLDVIVEENGSDHSDGEKRVEEARTLEERRGRAWEEAIFIPETNQIMFLSNDSEKGEYESLDNEGREGFRVRHRSIYYSEAKIMSYGMDSEERICRVYRREGNETRSMKTRFVSEDVSSDIFSEDMENALENADDTAECDSEDGREEASKDCDVGADVKVELAESSEDEDDMEVMWTRGRARERLGAVEIVYLEEDSGSTSSGSCVAAKTTEEESVRESVVEEDPDVVYEEVEFPVRLRGIIRISDAAQEEFSESNHVNVIYENTEFHRNTETVFKSQQTETDIKNADIVDTLQCSAVNESLAGIYEDIEFVREEISPTSRVKSKQYDSSATVACGENNLIRLTDSSNAIHGSNSRPNADNMRECRGNDDHNRVTDQLKATKGDDPRDIEGEKLATVDEAKSIRQSESIIEFNAESESRVETDDTAVTNDLSKIQKMEPHQSSVTVNSPVPSDELSAEERKDGMHVSECVNVDNSTTIVSSKTVSTGERISSLMPKRENVDKNCLETAMPHPYSGISRVESLKENVAEAITVENDFRQEEGRIEISTQIQSYIDSGTEIYYDREPAYCDKLGHDSEPKRAENNVHSKSHQITTETDTNRGGDIYVKAFGKCDECSQNPEESLLTLPQIDSHIKIETEDTYSRQLTFNLNAEAFKCNSFLKLAGTTKEGNNSSGTDMCIEQEPLVSISAEYGNVRDFEDGFDDLDSLTPTNRSPHGSSSSDAGSHGTAVYCPGRFSPQSSDADVSSYAEDTIAENKPLRKIYSHQSVGNKLFKSRSHENIPESKKYLGPAFKKGVGICGKVCTSPKTLTDLCIDKVLSLPHGVDILNILGINFPLRNPEKKHDCKNITLNTLMRDTVKSFQLLNAPSVSATYKSTGKSSLSGSLPDMSSMQQEALIRDQSSSINTMKSPPLPVSSPLSVADSDWMGMPTKEDPNLLVCLSPSQRQSYHQGESPTPEEAESLLDLHYKFVQRRGYNENPPPPPSRRVFGIHLFSNETHFPNGYLSDNCLNRDTDCQIPPSTGHYAESEDETSAACKHVLSPKFRAVLTSLDSKIPFKGNTRSVMDGLKDAQVEEKRELGVRENEDTEDGGGEKERDRSRSRSRLLAILRASSEPQEIQAKHLSPSSSCSPPPLPPLPCTYQHQVEMLGFLQQSRRPTTFCCSSNDKDFDYLLQHGPPRSPSYKKQNSCDISLQSPTRQTKGGGETSPCTSSIEGAGSKKERVLSWYGQGVTDGNNKERLKVKSLSDWLQLVRRGGSSKDSDGTRSKDPTPSVSACASTQSSPGPIRRDIRDPSPKPETNRSKDCGMKEHQKLKQEILERRFSLPERQLEQACQPDQKLVKPPLLPTSARDDERHKQQLKLLQQRQQRFRNEQLSNKTEQTQDKRPPLPQQQSKQKQLEPEVNMQELYCSHPVREQKQQSPVVQETQPVERRFDADNYRISKKGDIAIINSNAISRILKEEQSILRSKDSEDISRQIKSSQRPKSMPTPIESLVTSGEIFRQQMYVEYMDKVAERAERRRHKVIRLSSVPREDVPTSEPQDAAATAVQQLENEFMGRVRERMDKLGLKYDEESDDGSKTESGADNCYVISGGRAQEMGGGGDSVCQLPKHLQEFLTIAGGTGGDSDVDGVWSPSSKPSTDVTEHSNRKKNQDTKAGEDAPPVVWTPKSAGASPSNERKEFRPVNFESPTLSRKNRNGTFTSALFKPADDLQPAVTTSPLAQESTTTTTFSSIFPPWQQQQQSRDDSILSVGSTLHSPTSDKSVASSTITSTLDRRLVQSQSAPASGLSALAAGGPSNIKLPRAQNPTITLLQKAREGQLPRGALYLDHKMNSKEAEMPYVSPNDILYTVKKEYASEGENEQRKKIVELGPRKYEGIGPTTKEGIPIVLRSEVKDANQAKWYKRMYDSLHRAGKDDEYVTIRYKPRRGHYPYTSPGGYLSEPEPALYDSDIGYSAKYATLDRRRIKNKENDFTTSTLPRSRYVPHPASIKYATEVYKNQPGRIEDYEPGRSSISEKETKQWWDEVLDIFDGQTYAEPQTTPSTPSNKPFMTYALKESGYESDSTLVFKRRDENLQNQLSPAEQKLAYKTIQKGGEVPLHGLRKPAPERPKESPHRYVESEVTIHYRSPVRSEAKEVLSEEELARRQAEAMRRIYQEERRRKYLQELQDMHSRRHTDNFTPSQKSPIPLNRYDDFLDDVDNKGKSRDRTPEPKLVARALYNFVGQTSRELSFRRGDIIFVRRQIDKNWYEGEHNAMIGLFPFTYVEIIPYDGIRTIPKRPSEGQARAKFNFFAQTHLELSLVKGELVVLTRRVDDNWFEGRIGNRKGIFPVSYVEVLSESGEKSVTPVAPPSKPITLPASHTVLMNGSGIRQSMGQHSYQPSSYYSQNKMTSSYTSSNPYATLPRQSQTVKQPLAPVNQTLHIDTHSEPVPYRALYNYRPQNEDELELCEGDAVYVMEKCDDGWYVGSSQRTGYFGTFPGNYVERI